jgi:hypothetical protein
MSIRPAGASGQTPASGSRHLRTEPSGLRMVVKIRLERIEKSFLYMEKKLCGGESNRFRRSRRMA